jgi:hypothetical protein
MATRPMLRTRYAGLLLISLLALGLFTLAGCGQSGSGTGPSTVSVRATAPTATSTVAITAASILQHAQSVKFTDATLTMTFEGNLGNVAGLGGLPGASAQTSMTMTIKATTNPKRADVTMSFTSSDRQMTIETISDDATNTNYTRITPPIIPGDDKWTKSSGLGLGSLYDPSLYLNFSAVRNPTLVGEETLNGISVWYVKAQSSFGNDKAAEDIYVRADNLEPYQLKYTISGATNESVTITFIAINSHITIALPPASQVQSM